MKLDKDPLAVEQKNYLTKIVNVYIVYDLDAWPKIPLRNFTMKNCLLGATSIVKNSDKEIYLCSGYKTTFDEKSECSFNNCTARNVVIFVVGYSSSSHADNLNNNFLVLGEGDTLVLMEALVHQKKLLVLTLVKET